jgi:uncharacterized protein (DUF1697 family)
VTQHVVLLRGINIGASNRIAMPQLRELLTDGGFTEVRTYLQSGNVVLTSSDGSEAVARRCEQVIADNLGLDIAVVTRSGKEIAAVVRHNPFDGIADDPKRYIVSFLAAPLARDVPRKLSDVAVDSERVVAKGSELYAWLPGGSARSRLATMLAGRGLGVTATARNWTTVTNLLELAGS